VPKEGSALGQAGAVSGEVVCDCTNYSVRSNRPYGYRTRSKRTLVSSRNLIVTDPPAPPGRSSIGGNSLSSLGRVAPPLYWAISAWRPRWTALPPPSGARRQIARSGSAENGPTSWSRCRWRSRHKIRTRRSGRPWWEWLAVRHTSTSCYSSSATSVAPTRGGSVPLASFRGEDQTKTP
jgi:hypothetical protein